MTFVPQALGRRAPSDWAHYEKYPLTYLGLPEEVDVWAPVVLGVNWYQNFDAPGKVDDTWWIGRGDLGAIRGGHAICAKPWGVKDAKGWWRFYDQGQEGACVGFAVARAQTLSNRVKYAARDVYQSAQAIDEYEDTPPAEGTSVRAGLEVARVQGLRPVGWWGEASSWSQDSGISAYRWASTVDEVRAALHLPDNLPGVPLLNSWGTNYPHKVRITDEALERLLAEDGEAGIPTDR